MRAIGTPEPGGADDVRVLDVPEQHPGPGQLRIRVHFTTINPTDFGTISGAYGRGGPPFVPGPDAAGVVDEVGEDVTDWAVGDEVLAIVVPHSKTGGAWRDSVVVPVSQAVRPPKTVDLAHASVLPMNGLTAVLSLEALKVPGGGTVAVTGAAGHYGGFVVQLAKSEGAVVLADAKDSDVDLVTSLGADHLVERGDGFAAAVRAVVPGGVDGLADGAVQTEVVLDAIRDGGRMATIRGWSGPAPREIEVDPVMVYAHASRTDALERLVGLVDTGAITLRVSDVVKPADVVAALKRFQAGGVRGRIVIDLS